MQKVSLRFWLYMLNILFLLNVTMPTFAYDFTQEPIQEKNSRMQWWREARFGLFIHWGLYAIPAGKWGDKSHYGEWIRHEAQIPLEEYKKLLNQFNPTEFNAKEWVQLAKDAGMKYIVITSKHHDGFCLFDSTATDWDVMSTPFKRDILKELSQACREEGIQLCFYYSIMDWYHPDYLPRRDWEKDIRPETGANFDNYIAFMKLQLKELVQNYGPLGVLWFDGHWEPTWTYTNGIDLYNYVRSLQPNIIINNRVNGRIIETEKQPPPKPIGDFETPEQKIPDEGLPGIDWETCMTMNKHWGYNEVDKFYKTPQTLIHMLVDIVSKGGNFLLNVGPMANGKFPPESIQRLQQIGEWMRVNGDSIYGTSASPFQKPSWGRFTKKILNNGDSILYLHFFDYKPKSKVSIPVSQKPSKAYLLKDKEKSIKVNFKNNNLIIKLPEIHPDPYDTVIALEFNGNPFQ